MSFAARFFRARLAVSLDAEAGSTDMSKTTTEERLKPERTRGHEESGGIAGHRVVRGAWRIALLALPVLLLAGTALAPAQTAAPSGSLGFVTAPAAGGLTGNPAVAAAAQPSGPPAAAGTASGVRARAPGAPAIGSSWSILSVKAGRVSAPAARPGLAAAQGSAYRAPAPPVQAQPSADSAQIGFAPRTAPAVPAAQPALSGYAPTPGYAPAPGAVPAGQTPVYAPASSAAPRAPAAAPQADTLENTAWIGFAPRGPLPPAQPVPALQPAPTAQPVPATAANRLGFVQQPAPAYPATQPAGSVYAPAPPALPVAQPGASSYGPAPGAVPAGQAAGYTPPPARAQRFAAPLSQPDSLENTAWVGFAPGARGGVSPVGPGSNVPGALAPTPVPARAGQAGSFGFVTGGGAPRFQGGLAPAAAGQVGAYPPPVPAAQAPAAQPSTRVPSLSLLPAPAGAQSVRIGFVGPLTGPAAPYGLSCRQGIELALADAMSAERSGGSAYRFELAAEDDAGDEVRAGNAAVKLVSDPQVAAVLGAINSASTHVVAKVTMLAGVPQITSVSTDPALTRLNNRWFFRNLADDVVQGAALARYFFDSRGLKRVALVHDDNRYGKGGAKIVETEAAQRGTPVVLLRQFARGTTDFTALAEAIAAARPDGLIVWGLFGEAAGICKAVAAKGLKVVVAGGDGLVSPSFLKEAGTAAEGVVVTYPFDPARGDPLTRSFVERFRAAYGQEPDSFAAHSYDAASTVATVIKQVGPDRNRVREALASIRSENGVAGTGGFDVFGNAITPVQLAVVENGRFRLLGAAEVAAGSR